MKYTWLFNKDIEKLMVFLTIPTELGSMNTLQNPYVP